MNRALSRDGLLSITKKGNEMNKFEKIATALLAVIAVEGAVTTAEIVRIARNGFSMEIDLDEAGKLEEAATAAYEDMLNEEGE